MNVLDRMAGGEIPSIEVVEMFRVHLALQEPFVASHGTERERDVILVRVVDVAGWEGWGECPTLSEPGYTREHTAGAWRVLLDEIVPAWMRGEPRGLPEHPMARSALAGALVDAGLRAEGRSLVEAVGGVTRPLPSAAVVGMATSVDELLERCSRRVGEGHRHLKLKIGPGWDVEPLRAVARAFPSIGLAADANGSYVSAEAVPAALGSLGLAYLEQPLPPGELAGSAALRDGLGVTVALDESIGSAAALVEATRAGALDAVNVKAARVGGIVEARDLLDAARAAGVDAFVGGMLESGVGRAGGLALATHPACTHPTDLGPTARYFVDDVTEPVTLEPGGFLSPPRGPGATRVPSDDALRRLTVDRVEVTR